MLYLTPKNYVPIEDIRFIINLNDDKNFNKLLKQKIVDNNVEKEEVSRRRKRSLIMTEKIISQHKREKKVLLSNVNSATLMERINNNEVKSLKFLDLSYNNYIPISNILLIAEANTEPIKEIFQDLKEKKSLKLFNFTSVRKTKTVVFTIHGEVILSAIDANTLANRAKKEEDVFQSIGHNNYINVNHIHSMANRKHNNIREKIKAMEELSFKKVLKVSKGDLARTAIFCSNNYIILSKNKPETIHNNIAKMEDKSDD